MGEREMVLIGCRGGVVAQLDGPSSGLIEFGNLQVIFSQTVIELRGYRKVQRNAVLFDKDGPAIDRMAQLSITTGWGVVGFAARSPGVQAIRNSSAKRIGRPTATGRPVADHRIRGRPR